MRHGKKQRRTGRGKDHSTRLPGAWWFSRAEKIGGGLWESLKSGYGKPCLAVLLVRVDQPQTAQVDADTGFQQILGGKGGCGAGIVAGIKFDHPMAKRPDMR